MRTCSDIDECSESGGYKNITNACYSFSFHEHYSLILRYLKKIDWWIHFRNGMCQGECVNEAGSFNCQCPSGYRYPTKAHHTEKTC